MKTNNIIVYLLCCSSCHKDELTSFKSNDAINFTSENFTYSFLGNNTGEYIQEIPVRVIGNAKDYDRYFQIEVLNDSLTTASNNQYDVLEGIVKAGEFKGKLYVKIFNSDELNEESVGIHMKISNSDDFTKGNIESSYFNLVWTNKVVVPNWRYYSFFFTRVASTSAYRAVVASTGLTTFTLQDYRALGPTGAQALGTQFGDYVKQWNLDNPDNPLRHDDGTQAGELIEPLYYTKSLFD